MNQQSKLYNGFQVKICIVVLMGCLWGAGSTSAQEAAEGSRVPNLTGRTSVEVRQLLRLADLQGVSGVFYLSPSTWREEIDPEMVSLQAPRPGVAVARGGLVAYWRFAKAAEDQKQVKIPDLRGLDFKNASNRIDELELARSVAPGKGLSAAEVVDQVVIDQYPRPGQSVFVGTSVALQFAPSKSSE